MRGDYLKGCTGEEHDGHVSCEHVRAALASARADVLRLTEERDGARAAKIAAQAERDAVLQGQADLKAQMVRIRRAALGNEEGGGRDTEEIVRDLRAERDAARGRLALIDQTLARWDDYMGILRNRADEARAVGDADGDALYRTAVNNIRSVVDDLRAALAAGSSDKGGRDGA